MAKGLEAFKVYHENQNDIFALKDSILRSHHGLETLFKNVLYGINPVLLVRDDRKVKEIIDGYEKFAKGETSTVLDETKTTTLEVTIERLRRLGFIKIDNREYSAFQHAISELCSFRNQLQHLGISANADVVGRILGTVLPRGIDILENIPSREPFTSASLESFYPQSKAVIELLRNTYDTLVKDAIAFFAKREFVDQELIIKVNDHGHVGAPPYFAELNISGFLKYNYERMVGFLYWKNLEKELPYQASVNIGQPTFTKGAFPDMGLAKGNITLNAQMLLDLPNGSILLPDAEEKLRVLRGVSVVIKGNLDYEAEAMMNDWHYDVQKLKTAEGKLSVKIAALPRGYTNHENEIIGEYEAQLDESNAPFRLHSFVEPSGLIATKNYVLDWDIISKNTLKFQ